MTDRSLLWTVPPIYRRHDGEVTAVLPVFWKTRTSLFLAPNLYVWDDPAGSGFSILPLVHRQRASHPGADDVLWVFPYHRAQKDASSTTAVVPFYVRAESPTRRVLRLGPWKTVRADTERSTELFPFFTTGEGIEGTGLRRHRRSYLAGLYQHEEARDVSGALVRRYRRFLAFSDESDADSTTLRFLGFPIVEQARKS